MRKSDVIRRILLRLDVEIEPSQWGLIRKIYDLENQGFIVSIVSPRSPERIQQDRRKHNCNAFFEIRHYDYNVSSGYNPESIRTYLKKAKIESPEKIDSSNVGWFFEKQRVCGYFLGDDIPF
ncbi:hypothetical protein A3K73_03110 [Candidatus Pacearchaeota archaeon RBG_13_36_9]|nr:MAG: hypothetical protein A3K73_03110 [Candidatus Pacearchaeota archaeon RBG_13_36_9]